jgi:diaminohydroxyphosphoribosylaminopyrimidine deaminase/5-amino-6-(5-phosphoribosylamino)uracil reductase
MNSSPDDTRFMATAIRLARHGLDSTSPNPRVGCVLVRNGELIAEGWHNRAGEPHAEALALAVAGENARGGTAYVTLEPCSHHGRTGPCADALVAAGISRVVVGTEDPNPRVRGQGIARLRAAGIEVEVGVLEREARALNPGFFARMTRGRPWLCCKLAMSLDGRTAMASGESKWITGESARQDVQRLRARSCAVMTGIGTVLTDDPRLDVRLGDAASARQPLRVVLDSQLRTPPGARLTATPGHALVVHADAHPGREQALVGAGCELLRLPDGQGRVALPALLDALAARECNEVLLEAGAALCGAFAAAGLIDEYRIYMAPVLLGSRARPLLELPFEHMAERLQLRITAVEAVGEDWRITAVPRA